MLDPIFLLFLSSPPLSFPQSDRHSTALSYPRSYRMSSSVLFLIPQPPSPSSPNLPSFPLWPVSADAGSQKESSSCALQDLPLFPFSPPLSYPFPGLSNTFVLGPRSLKYFSSVISTDPSTNPLLFSLTESFSSPFFSSSGLWAEKVPFVLFLCPFLLRTRAFFKLWFNFRFLLPLFSWF